MKTRPSELAAQAAEGPTCGHTCVFECCQQRSFSRCCNCWQDLRDAFVGEHAATCLRRSSSGGFSSRLSCKQDQHSSSPCRLHHRAEHSHHDFFDLWSSRVRDLKEFGVGHMMYFFFLRWMAVLFAMLSVVSAVPNMALNYAGK
eukprot:GHRQ01014831.1.p2 GENE.GHRQ01014831.1~~GHRQ01014831.1.p2  ORF type:complete len:144 (-),score=21.84 GHRQ01014831.1:828-1259(-)